MYLGALYLGSYAVGGSAPESPPGDLAAVLALGTVTLTWSDTVSDNTGYIVERKAGGAAFATFSTVGANVTTEEDATTTPGVVYRYRLQVVGGALDGQFSNTVTVGSSGAIYPNNVGRHRRRLINAS